MTPASIVTAIKVPLAALLLGGFAAADLWHFHSLAATTSLGMIVAAGAALGVSTAYTAGQTVAAAAAAQAKSATP